MNCTNFAVAMKILTSAQIRELDRYTIEHEPISSLDLMERAARALTRAVTERWGVDVPVVVFAGPGNNGGDALAVARMLNEQGYQVQTFLFNVKGKLSADCAANKQRLCDKKGQPLFTEVTLEFDPPRLEEGMLVVDGLFGSGLDKPLAGGFASLVKYINMSKVQVVSIDVPSGLMTEDNTYNARANIIHADLTLTLQQPKLSFFFPENQKYLGEVCCIDIGLSQEGIRQAEALYATVEEAAVAAMLKPRDPFTHKGKMGHALLIAGRQGMAGASILAARACMRAGAGKLTVHVPSQNTLPLQVAVPEAVLHFDKNDTHFSEAVMADDYQAMAIGPGLGDADATGIAMITQLKRCTCPVVADADALNILAAKNAWMQQLPKGIILTPHPKELDRLEGPCTDSFERLSKARDLAKRLAGYVVLKGHHTAICMPDGHVFLNMTGNAGMATAGSGDVLTGILLGLLARGYSQQEACLLGVWLHGLAGDLAAEELGEESLVASDIVNYLSKAFLALDDRKNNIE